MSYKARVYNVMIASPSDTMNKRIAAKTAINKWNGLHSYNDGIVLLPLMWETHSAPSMNEKAQAVINKQILDKADIVIGIFNERLGTPTESYQSGTVEEIVTHMDRSRPTMVYFKGESNIVDENTNEYKKVKKFREEYCQPKGLYWVYEDNDNFEDLIYNKLQIMLNTHDCFKSETKKVLFEGSLSRSVIFYLTDSICDYNRVSSEFFINYNTYSKTNHIYSKNYPDNFEVGEVINIDNSLDNAIIKVIDETQLEVKLNGERIIKITGFKE